MIKLPPEWKVYYNTIRERCEDLIELGIWTGIDHVKLDLWRKNFSTDEERFLSACLLDALTYRSGKQIYSLIYEQLFRCLPNFFNLQLSTSSNAELFNFPNCLQQNLYDPQIRLTAVIRSTDNITKSTSVILRHVRRLFDIKDEWIVEPEDIESCISSGVNVFIFVDDFLGSGDQFSGIIETEGVKKILDTDIVIVYAPLVAHEYGIGQLNLSYPKLKLCYVEYLEYSKHNFFENYFNDSLNNPQEARKFYEEFLKKHSITGDIFGYGELEITYAFEHSCPDNSLPILHHKDSLTFSPLIIR
jgi:hypothetical protein